MQKVERYALMKCTAANGYIDKGWQPWGNAIIAWDGQNNVPHQPMVKYEEEKD